MRLIDADALYKSFGASGNCGSCQLDAYKCQYYNEHTLMEFCERIDDAPTVDAVEVVRCKDCKKYIPCQKLPIGTSKWCDMFDRATCEMNYCGWGERREDGIT